MKLLIIFSSAGGVLVLVFLILNWLTRRFPRRMTRAQCAKIIEDYIAGRGGRWDWEDFTTIALDDPILEDVRRWCSSLFELYPDSKADCNREGIEALTDLARALRMSDQHGNDLIRQIIVRGADHPVDESSQEEQR